MVGVIGIIGIIAFSKDSFPSTILWSSATIFAVAMSNIAPVSIPVRDQATAGSGVPRYKVCPSYQLVLAALAFAEPLLKAILRILSTSQYLETDEDPANHLVVFRPPEHANSLAS
jgi:hypothetical protein